MPGSPPAPARPPGHFLPLLGLSPWAALPVLFTLAFIPLSRPYNASHFVLDTSVHSHCVPRLSCDLCHQQAEPFCNFPFIFLAISSDTLCT